MSFPATLSGTITVLQHQPSWKGDSGVFDGYTAKAVFLHAKFGSGADGPWTLLSGTVSYSGFRVTQSAPDPEQKSATCVAVYVFNLGKLSRPDGNIGGGPVSHGKYMESLSLDIPAAGRITHSANCGPGDEFTSHVFGEPPRIDVDVEATGTYSPSTRTLTLHSVVKTQWELATQTDTVTGTLTG